MHLPCANQQCNRSVERELPKNRTHLCLHCRWLLQERKVPTCGLIPSSALSQIAKELLVELKPTQSELKDALKIMRGPRHREGDWEARPTYSAAVVHAIKPTPKLSRRLPEFLIGRRTPPTPNMILVAAVHHRLALDVLGVGRRPALFLAGATYFQRRALIRPKGQRREYMGRQVNNAYHLKYREFVSIGRLTLKAAKVLGFDDHSHTAQITTRYLTGVEAGEFNRPIVVHPACGITSGAGDHPLDHFLPRQDFAPNLPTFNSKIRRASGKIAGREEYPKGFDVSLEEQLEATRRETQTRFARTQINTTAAPSTDWLFTD